MDPALTRLERDIRWLKAYAAAATVAVAVVALTGAKGRDGGKVLSVEQINIVDPSGVARLVIANSERFPLPKLDGKVYPRAVQPAGMVFYNATGGEVGGIAVTDAGKGKVSAIAFDYPNYDAIGMRTVISADGQHGNAGIVINSRPPPELDVAQAGKVVRERIAIQNDDETAEVVLSDPQGRPRIRLRVDVKGEAGIEVLKPDGSVSFKAP